MEEDSENPVPVNIHEAAFYGDLNMATLFVEEGSNINGYDEVGFTALHYAVVKENLDMIVHLVTLGAEVNAITSFKNQTPAHWAARLGKTLILHMLFRLGASLSVQDNTPLGKTPLHTAVKYDHEEVIIWMFQMGLSMNITDRGGGTPLFYAIYYEYTHLVQLLIDQGTDVNTRYTGLNNLTPLHMAITGENMDIIRILLRNGANMYIPCTGLHETPVHCAAKKGELDILELLHEFGCIFSVQKDDRHGNRPIHVAAKKGHLAVVAWLVSKGESVNCTNNRGYTPLHKAVSSGQLGIASYLLQEGSQVYARTNYPELYSPLNIATRCGNLDMIDLLIHYGANVNAEKQTNGYTALHHAVKADNLECLKCLKKNGGNIMVHMGSEQEPLITTAIRNDSECVIRWLLETEISVNVKLRDGMTPLHQAADYGKEKMALILIKRGANINCRDDSISTPLHYAVVHGNVSVTQLLISRGADTEAENDFGQNSLHLAAGNREPHCLQILVLGGGDIMSRSNHGNRDFLIHTAVMNGRVNIIRWLIDRGMPVDVRNSMGVTPLLAASKADNYNIATLLVNKGADVNVRYDPWGKCTPLHLACASGNRALVQLLIENGADVNARAIVDSRTPLHWAVYYQHNVIVHLLIRSGADPYIEDSQGYTAAGLAAYEGHNSIYEFLKTTLGEIISLF